MMIRRYRQIKNQILKRRVPHTLVSWRFLMPGQSQSVRLHRKVFLGAWPRIPRWQWGLIFLYSECTWLFFFSWQQIYICMGNRRVEVSNQFGVSVQKQFIDLLALALLHGIPPHFYYQYHLFRKSHKQWMDYIYTHELPHWHQVLSAEISQKSLRLMTNKKDFAEYMAEKGIASVDSCEFFSKGDPVKASNIFLERSFFFKPNKGSRSEDCFALLFNGKTRQYHLSGEESIEAKEEILGKLNLRVHAQDYLVQPLLSNHPQIIELCGTSELVTLRLVTGIIGQQAVALFATLEIPRKDDEDGWCLFALDMKTGQLFDKRAHALAKQTINIQGKTLPFWQQAVALCVDAHHHFPDILTIGWDVVIAVSGIKLLEGNINWGVASHQVFTDEPALETALATVYGVSG
ncbi:MAG: hypothetical protein BMS9Abin18_1324 [Zetaproteobacteria bacterium]|nr:MAG: hypothetical protein BMS9Abin18_1324 [Zetaproteobacteria bacterium]